MLATVVPLKISILLLNHASIKSSDEEEDKDESIERRSFILSANSNMEPIAPDKR